MPSPRLETKHEAAGIHHASRQRDGSVAAPRARATVRAGAAHRHTPARNRGPFGISGPRRGVPAGAGAIGLDIGRNVRIDTRWATTNHAELRRHAEELVALAPDVILAPGASALAAVAAGDPHCANCVPVRHRSGRCRLCRQPGAAGRQRHRFHIVRIQPGREMAGVAQRDRAARDASGRPSGCRHSIRDRPVRRDPVRGAIVRGGVEPSQRARRRRDRARRRGLRALPEWRSDRDCGPVRRTVIAI